MKQRVTNTTITSMESSFLGNQGGLSPGPQWIPVSQDAQVSWVNGILQLAFCTHGCHIPRFNCQVWSMLNPGAELVVVDSQLCILFFLAYTLYFSFSQEFLTSGKTYIFIPEVYVGWKFPSLLNLPRYQYYINQFLFKLSFHKKS